MMRFALMLIVWVIAIYAIVSVSEHRRQNAGLPVVKSAAAARPVWTILPQCPVTSRNLPRYVERIA